MSVMEDAGRACPCLAARRRHPSRPGRTVCRCVRFAASPSPRGRARVVSRLASPDIDPQGGAGIRCASGCDLLIGGADVTIGRNNPSEHDQDSASGTGVKASSAIGTALSVDGRTQFSRSGSASVPQGSNAKTVKLAGVKSSSLVLVTLQTSITDIYVASAVPAAGKFTVHLNSN